MRTRRHDAPTVTPRTSDIDTLLSTRVLSVSYEPGALASPRHATLLLQAHPAMYLAPPSATVKMEDDEWDGYKAPWAGKTAPRYSEAGLFKVRLDALFGRGSMLRGFGRRPMGAEGEAWGLKRALGRAGRTQRRSALKGGLNLENVAVGSSQQQQRKVGATNAFPLSVRCLESAPSEDSLDSAV